MVLPKSKCFQSLASAFQVRFLCWCLVISAAIQLSHLLLFWKRHTVLSSGHNATAPESSARVSLFSQAKYRVQLDRLVFNNDQPENETLQSFLELYEGYCRDHIPRDHVRRDGRPRSWCPCVPNGLAGHLNVTNYTGTTPATMEDIAHAHPEMMSGGHWSPRDCRSRQHIAVIVPYRDRDIHLRIFSQYMIPFLQRQLLEFTIFLVEQGKPAVFNKAAIMNAGFLEAEKREHFDCYFFHDVDTLPEDDRNFYTCADSPRHLGMFVTKFRYRPLYNYFVGGGTSFTADQFRRMNGFSNKFYGWGGEDDNAYHRITMSGMQACCGPVHDTETQAGSRQPYQ